MGELTWPQYTQCTTCSAVLISSVYRLSETLGLLGPLPRGGRTVSKKKKKSTAESDATGRLCTLICSSEFSAENFRSAQHLMQALIGPVEAQCFAASLQAAEDLQ